MAIEQQRVHSIKHLDSLLEFLIKDLHWKYPKAEIEDISFEWTGDDLNLSEDIHLKLKGGLIRQLQPFAAHQPWGVFVVEFTTKDISIETLRQILRCFVAKRRNVRSDLPAWKCENLLFICLYGGNGFSFVHFKGDKPYAAKLTTFSWHPGEPIRTVCEFNLPALAYTDTWTPDTWVNEWQKAFDVEKVNKEFYRQIAQFYYRLTGKEEFTRELTLPSVGDSPGNISYYEEFAVRLIGRTIFCWFLKHKESGAGVPLIPEEALSLKAAQNAGDYYHLILEPLFFEVMNKPVKNRRQLSVPHDKIVPFLNGGLFDPHPYDFYPGSPNRGLKIPDDWFIEFFTLLEHYNFTITENSSINIDVAVDPEMLGRIFENLLAEVVPETGETARKATGSYYTPRAIVDYMVEQSLKQYLLTKTGLGEEKVSRLLEYGEDIEDFTAEERLQIVTAFREIKVIDPACGSGAFPMGVLHRMLAVMEKADSRLEIWRSQYLKTLDGIVRQTVEKNISRENWAYIRKLIVIRDSIYGVDIQPIAVEIAKLRCFLSLVVDEIVIDSEENRGIEPLPNLEFKFVAANTLIGLPAKIEDFGAFEARDLTEKLRKLRIEYLTGVGKQKEQLKKEFLKVQGQLRAKIDWALPTSQSHTLATWDPFSYESCSWFNPEWMFGVSDGFDIVIANPPYIDSELMVKEQPILRQKYSELYSSAKGNWDLYVLFLELGHIILTSTGTASFITPNKWYAIGYGKEIRKILVKNIYRIANCNSVKVFEAGNSPVVTIFGKIGSTDEIAIDRFNNDFSTSNSLSIQREFLEDNLGLSLSDHLSIVHKIRNQSNIISDYYIAENPFSVSEAYEMNEILRDLSNYKDSNGPYFRFVNTGTIEPFLSLWGEKNTTYLKSKYHNPVVNKSTFKKLFPKRYEQTIKAKIIISGMRHFESFLDEDGQYIAGKSTEILIKKNNTSLKVALGILNSKLIIFYIKQSYSVLGIDGGINFTTDMIESLPIPKLDEVDFQSSLISLVDQILTITKYTDCLSNPTKQAKMNEYQRQIDQMVYQIYGLTPEEIAVVEGNT